MPKSKGVSSTPTVEPILVCDGLNILLPGPGFPGRLLTPEEMRRSAEIDERERMERKPEPAPAPPERLPLFPDE